MRSKPAQIRSYADARFQVYLEPSSVTDEVTAQYSRFLCKEMADRAFVNLSEFPYTYLTSGATEAIDWVLPRQRTKVLANDYRYARAYHTPTDQELLYLSYPFAGTGDFVDIPSELPVFLDCSYIFASSMDHDLTVPKQVKYLAFSLSKSHNVANYRIGWLMTREPLYPQHLVQYEYSYVPHRHHQVLSAAVKEPSNLLYTMWKERISALYRKHGLREGATNLFGTDSAGNRVPFYTLE